jgi:membrane protein YdbS with pleckstrin-like domain
MHYSISETSLQTRKKNIFLGALFALVLAAVITAGHFQYPETYNNMVFWSVIIVVAVGNLVNYYRYRRYLRLVEDHRIEIGGDEVSFFTREYRVLRYFNAA